MEPNDSPEITDRGRDIRHPQPPFKVILEKELNKMSPLGWERERERQKQNITIVQSKYKCLAGIFKLQHFSTFE